MSFLPYLVFVFTLLGTVGQAEQVPELVEFMFDTIPADMVDALRRPVG